MNGELLRPFGEILSTIEKHQGSGWVYLPEGEPWGLESCGTVLESEEVPPEREDDTDAGIPAFAKQNGLRQTLPVSTVQDIIENARSQKPDASLEVFLAAFLFYFKNDAFIDLG